MGYCLYPKNSKVSDLDVNVWNWGATMSLIQRSGILKEGEEIHGDSPLIEPSAESCNLLAKWLEEHILPTMEAADRIKVDGTVTSTPDDYKFHRENLDENYSVPEPWLKAFVEFLKTCDGFNAHY